MDIKQIGLIERIFKPKKNQPIKQRQDVQNIDKVSISSSALQKSKDSADERIKEIVMNAPDVRIDRINEVKSKLNQDGYVRNIDNEILAEKILKSPFGFNIKPY